MDGTTGPLTPDAALRSTLWTCLCCDTVHRFRQPLLAPRSCVCGSVSFEPQLPPPTKVYEPQHQALPQSNQPNFNTSLPEVEDSF